MSFLVGTAFGVVYLIGSASAGEGRPGPEVRASLEQYFEQKVRPLLAENCYSCHGGKKQKGGLRLDSLEAILKGGEAGPVVVPGKPGESLLVEAIHYQGLEMPPTGKLAPRKSRCSRAGSRWERPGPAAIAWHMPVRHRFDPRSRRLLAASRALWSLPPAAAAAPCPISPSSGRSDWAGLVAKPDRPLHPRRLCWIVA